MREWQCYSWKYLHASFDGDIGIHLFLSYLKQDLVQLLEELNNYNSYVINI